MSYYWFNRKDLLKRAHNKYHKEASEQRAANYHETNKEKIKNKQRDRYKNLSKEEKYVIKERSLRRYYKK